MTPALPDNPTSAEPKRSSGLLAQPLTAHLFGGYPERKYVNTDS